MFKQIWNFARPGVAQAQKNRPKAVGWGVCDLPLGAVPLPRRHRLRIGPQSYAASTGGTFSRSMVGCIAPIVAQFNKLFLHAATGSC